MEKPNYAITKRRSTIIALVVVLVLFAYFARLFQVQIVQGEEYAAKSEQISTITLTTGAARGEIYDRYMRPLTVNRVSYSVVFDWAFYPRGDATLPQRNAMILSLAGLMEEHGGTWTDTLPITAAKPFEFVEDSDSRQAALKKHLNLADYATAQQCMDKLIKEFELSGYKASEQRRIAGVQYEIATRQFSLRNPFTFSSDVSDAVRNIILENNSIYPGVTITTNTVREYVNGDIASHLLGTVGPIFESEYDTLKEKGYQYNDLVGRGGIESAMEDALRGQSGEIVITRKANGTVLSREETVAPVAGDSIILTLDKDLQKKAQEELDYTINLMRSRGGKNEFVKSGAIVMMTPNGEILACATWPNYDLSQFNSQYAALTSDPDKPLVNRAVNEAFPCGSVIKPGIALAGTGSADAKRTPLDKLYGCNRRYTFYSTTFHCTGSHGWLDAKGAVAKSCNCYFYELGRIMGIDNQVKYNTVFGLGQKTGIEIRETTGNLASPATSKEWYEADKSLAAIGQSTNQFTPLQLAVYTTALANNGTRYNAHLVKSVRSYNGLDTPTAVEKVASADFTQESLDAVRQGMQNVTKSGGTAASAFSKMQQYKVAGKTGTAQHGINTKWDHSWFVGYAPADQPEICIAAFLEYGRNNDNRIVEGPKMAARMLQYYFENKHADTPPTPENQLLP